MDRSCKSDTSSESRSPGLHFLSLPGELRNRIYDIAMAEEVGLEAEELPRLVHTQPSLKTSFGRIEERENMKRKAYGLTQTCRQIRKEFLPVYRSDVKVRIDIRDLQHYLTDVVQAPSIDPTQAYGNIIIDINERCEANIREVLLLNNRSPNLHLSLLRPEEADETIFFLLDAGAWPKLDAFIAEKTREVVLQVNWDPQCGNEMWSTCRLIVKEEFVGSWMRNKRKKWNITYQWEAEVGLEDMNLRIWPATFC